MSFEPYPAEVAEAKRIVGELQIKYGKKYASSGLLEAFQREAHDEFTKAGLIVDVDPGSLDVNGNLEFLVVPKVYLVGRIDGTNTDYDRMKFEHQAGYADGKPGVMREDGTMKDPSTNLLG